MAKPNYSFEKRQKEIAKKKKQEEKMAEKRLRKANPDGEQLPADDLESSTDADADATAETAADDSAEPSNQA
ncbi:MAG: hypothetical protein Q8R10_10595 [Pseudomonas sp.]|uniref:hypothetical protein n=1 Tax=Pseudomonas sp. TaxID=306 RepID=UPI0027329F82|nr:hypothetical protein [Pseudomonas sp.]MDP3846854.1 hypothetical protein [Pseudomonas sp.]